jgi:hypothetical protein
MAEARLPTPRHARICGLQDVTRAAAHVGFPAIIKPVAGGAPPAIEGEAQGGGRRSRCVPRALLSLGGKTPGQNRLPPSDAGAASIGVIRVDSLDDLRSAYARVVRDLSRARIVAGALVEGEGEGPGPGLEGGAVADEAAQAEAAAGDHTGAAAGSWIDVDLMMEEVGGGGAAGEEGLAC